MIIQNVWVYTEEKTFVKGAVWLEKGQITKVDLQEAALGRQQSGIEAAGVSQEIVDGQGGYLIPGMIDIHTHGCMGYDFCDGTYEAVRQIAAYQASIGVTTFAPATMTLPIERLEEILKIGAAFQLEKANGQHAECADLAGINMEGPFISREKKGAQKEEYILPANVEVYHRFQQAAKCLVKYVGLAPERDGSLEFIRQVKDEVKVTVAHSNADYETAKAAFEAGACHVTHLYNAMPAYNHREPGIVGAVADCRQVKAELIGDGLHVHPAVLRGTFAMLGGERIILISDSIRAAGMPDGEYELGGQKVILENGKALLENGTIAGSICTLPQCLRYAVKEAGIPLETAAACVTMNPAKSLGIFEECGSIAVGKRADLVLLDEDLQVKKIWKAGLEL